MDASGAGVVELFWPVATGLMKKQEANTTMPEPVVVERLKGVMADKAYTTL